MQDEPTSTGDWMSDRPPTPDVAQREVSEPAHVPELTGDAAVDEALRLLPGLETRPVHEHAAVIESVHGVLRDRLADEPVDDQPGEGQG